MGIAAEAYARMQRALLPPGKIWELDLCSWLYKILLAAGDELARVDARVQDLLTESDPRTANELLPDYERVLNLDGSGTTAERQQRIAGLLVRRGRVRPADFREVLAPLLGVTADQVVVIERSRADAIAMGDDREIFRFFIYRDPALPGTYDLEGAQLVVDRMKQSHTVGHVIESINFLCDDPYSLCDRDLLGV